MGTAELEAVDRPRLLKVAEVAEELRLSRSAVYQAIAEGRLAAVRLRPSRCGHLRVPSAELERFLHGDDPDRGEAA